MDTFSPSPRSRRAAIETGGDAEIENLHLVVRGEEDVARFKIPVDHVAAVGVGNGIGKP